MTSNRNCQVFNDIKWERCLRSGGRENCSKELRGTFGSAEHIFLTCKKFCFFFTQWKFMFLFATFCFHTEFVSQLHFLWERVLGVKLESLSDHPFFGIVGRRVTIERSTGSLEAIRKRKRKIFSLKGGGFLALEADFWHYAHIWK